MTKAMTIHYSPKLLAFSLVLGVAAALVPLRQAIADEDDAPEASMTSDRKDTPPSIKVPEGQRVVLRSIVTEGTQTYKCSAQGKYEFLGPTAMLRGPKGQYTAHYFGPSWQYQDGSAVVGKVIASEPRENTIPELLLEVTEHKGLEGLFSRVTFIQRLKTIGGVAPESCDPNRDKKALPVPYSALYKFWGPAN